MFKILKVKSPDASTYVASDINHAVTVGFDRFCFSESWTGDLASGLFRLGAISEELHGLGVAECGLLTLLRCYEATDRFNILEILENASSAATSFCFSTFIKAESGEMQPVICIGESSGFDGQAAAHMHGIFLYPRLSARISRQH